MYEVLNPSHALVAIVGSSMHRTSGWHISRQKPHRGCQRSFALSTRQWVHSWSTMLVSDQLGSVNEKKKVVAEFTPKEARTPSREPIASKRNIHSWVHFTLNVKRSWNSWQRLKVMIIIWFRNGHILRRLRHLDLASRANTFLQPIICGILHSNISMGSFEGRSLNLKPLVGSTVQSWSMIGLEFCRYSSCVPLAILNSLQMH